MVSLGVEEPRHEHEGLFVSALAILTSDCHTGEGESVGGEEVGRKLEPGCLASPLSPPDPPLLCIGAPHTQRLTRKLKQM